MSQNEPKFFDKLFGDQGFKFSLFNFGQKQHDKIDSLSDLNKDNLSPIHSTTKLKDVTEKYCPEILKSYPLDKYQDEYAQTMFMIKTELKFKESVQPGQSWILLKTVDEVQKFTKKFGEDHKVNQQNLIGHLFNALSKPPESKGKHDRQFYNFIEQSAPHDKWNMKIVGQFPVQLIETQGVRNCLTNYVCKPCRKHDKYYITVTTQNMIFSQHELVEGQIEEAIPYTREFQVKYAIPELEHIAKFNAYIRSGRSKFRVGFHKLHDLVKFAFVYNQIRAQTEYFKPVMRFESFSPERSNNWAQFYTDGQGYFSDLYDEIQKATKKICITGWCITPYYLLKRPIQSGADIHTTKYRLDHTLDRAAKRGVKIFIIVFQEPSLFVNNDSFNVFNIFQNLDDNFKVLRHPGLVIPQMWSHHEKSVIIDENVAFMGGLDICYGRWDKHTHPIHDQNGLWYGADYNNERQRGITEPRKYDQSNLDRLNEPRMPWHDIALQLKGPAVVDLQRHFVQYWYFALRDLSDDPKDHLRNYLHRYREIKKKNQRIQQEEKLKEEYAKKEKELFEKKKVTDEEMKVIEFTYFSQKTSQPQKNQYTFKERYTNAKQAFKDLLQHKLSRSSKQIFVEGFSTSSKAGLLKMQLCRSSCTWSTGIKNVEHSIYNAYRKLIQESESFIYIQNQFFMSFENLISEDLAARIIKAYEEKKEFKLIVMMPLLPGFEGDVTKTNSGILRAQMQIQFQAISRHKDSLMQIILDYNIKQQKNIKIEDYVIFTGLRNHARFNAIPKTQIIYVHSKLMIVDDKRMIIGSANINDRSLMGKRDSELAMVIENPLGDMGQGQIFDFRCTIFKEHYDMSSSQCSNIRYYWKDLIKYAVKNAQIYREIFGCIPDNTAVHFTDIPQLQKRAKPYLYESEISKLKGHYVEWPVDFLRYEDLRVKGGQKEALMPVTFFT